MTPPTATGRTGLIGRFLASQGWADADRHALAGDASARRYHRLDQRNGQTDATVILVDSPYPDVDVIPFLDIGALLARMRFSVPAVVAAQAHDGLLLLEDFGNDTFSRLLAQGADPEPLYRLAVDVLIALHQRYHPDLLNGRALPVFDAALFVEQVMLFADAYMPIALGQPLPTADRAALETAWHQVLPLACAGPQSLMLRDYHVDNLMLLPGRSDLGACGLLDFQGAGLGPVAYDLISLLEDARRDVGADLAAAMVAHYKTAFPDLDDDAFGQSCDVLGAVRHARILGIFMKIATGQGRRTYLAHMPRVWRLLEGRLAKPALAPVRAWFDRHLPPASRAPLILP